MLGLVQAQHPKQYYEVFQIQLFLIDNHKQVAIKTARQVLIALLEKLFLLCRLFPLQQESLVFRFFEEQKVAYLYLQQTQHK